MFSAFDFLFVSFWLYHVACGILVLRPGIEPMPPTMEVQSLSHRTTKEVQYELKKKKRKVEGKTLDQGA